MIRVIIVGIITAAVAVAIGYTLTPYGWLEDRFRYFSPGFDFTGGDNGGESPRIIVVHVSNDIIYLNGKEVFRPPTNADGRGIIFEGLKNEIVSIEKEAGKPSGVMPGPDPENDPVIIRCNDDVRFSLLIRVLCTFWAADYEKVFLATPPVEENRIEVLPVFRPREIRWVYKTWFPDYINIPIEENRCVCLSDKGFYIGAGGTHSILVPLKEGRYDYDVMKATLSLVSIDDDEYVRTVSEPDILFPDVIDVMGVCAELGLNKIALTEHSMDLEEVLRDNTTFQRTYPAPTGGLK